VFYDIANRESFEALDGILEFLRETLESQAFFGVIGAKSDLEGSEKVQPEEARDWCAANFASYLGETSARKGENIKEVCDGIVEAYSQRNG
jgi:hypothetical protein